MRVFIAGMDGYLGWSLTLYLLARGHTVGGCDNGSRRRWVAEVGGQSVTPIADMPTRLGALRESGRDVAFWNLGLTDYSAVFAALEAFQPDAIVHVGEMPSAPYSMIDAAHAAYTHTNNLVGTLNILWSMLAVCPGAHLVKIGTMGEYGTPNVDIPEGTFELEFRGRRDHVLFPRRAGSFYHLTKVHDTHNVEFACRTWGLRATDIMQGVVFGTRLPEMGDDDRLRTRFDCDGVFGTALNRFCAQAVIGMSLSVYGSGRQRRGFLPICDSMQCLTLAIENPPAAGEYRTFNQFEETYSIVELACLVERVGDGLGLDVRTEHLGNPRVEADTHYYRPDRQKLIDLGYQPTHNIQQEVRVMLIDLLQFRDVIAQSKPVLLPNVQWKGPRKTPLPEGLGR